jgi:predicted nucleic acid-binding protein
VEILADTNILLRRLHRANPQHRQARDAINKFSRDGNRLCVASQNLVELWAVRTRPVHANGFGLTPGQTGRVLALIESSVIRLPDSDAIYVEWRRLVAAHGVCGKTTHDARLVAAMVVHGVKHILTFNADDFARYTEIEVLHPSKLGTM